MTRTARLFVPLALLCSTTALAQITPAPNGPQPPSPPIFPADGPDEIKVPPPPGQVVPPRPAPALRTGRRSSGPAPDASYRAMINRPVVLLLRGNLLACTIVSVELTTVTVIIERTGLVVTVPKADVAEMRIAAPPAPAPYQPPLHYEPPVEPEVPGSVIDEG